MSKFDFSELQALEILDYEPLEICWVDARPVILRLHKTTSPDRTGSRVAGTTVQGNRCREYDSLSGLIASITQYNEAGRSTESRFHLQVCIGSDSPKYYQFDVSTCKSRRPIIHVESDTVNRQAIKSFVDFFLTQGHHQ